MRRTFFFILLSAVCLGGRVAGRKAWITQTNVAEDVCDCRCMCVMVSDEPSCQCPCTCPMGGGGGDPTSGDDSTSGDDNVAPGALIPGLINTNFQPMFETIVPNALDPSYIYQFDTNNFITVEACKNSNHETGLVDDQQKPLKTPIYGYRQQGSESCVWPGFTFQIQAKDKYNVKWLNKLPIEEYLLTSLDGVSVVDTSVHWAFSLPGYESYSISTHGVPTVVHHHGGHNGAEYDGQAEAFYTPDFEIIGPDWMDEVYEYSEEVAGARWYHDHALGITRLNVYTGMAGFFFTRGDRDTGKPDNPLHLPAFPYETALAIQDRMFKEDGSLFYPAFPGDPSYDGYIQGAGVVLPTDLFPGGGPTALAEFFGDVMVVNGKIWPKMEVEPRNYRFRLLNGCDSRFLIMQFAKVSLGETEVADDAEPLPFTIIGSDEGLAWRPETTDTLVIQPGARYDVVFDFKDFDGCRIVMRNIGLDVPFNGYFDPIPPPKTGTTYLRTNRIMAFDVVTPLDAQVEDNFDPSRIHSVTSEWLTVQKPTNTRRVGLFEGSDPYGRILPLVGSVDPATDCNGTPVVYPDTEMYAAAGLAGQQIEGTATWSDPTTENIQLNTTEEWEIWNFSVDAHPIHLHLVFFQMLDRYQIIWDSNTTDASRVIDPTFANGDGTYLVEQPVVMHNGLTGKGARVVNPTKGDRVSTPPGYFENGPKDVVIAPPGQITRIKAHFDKPGTYMWHCHILAHEDFDMMRKFNVCGEDQETGDDPADIGMSHFR